jgi:hypothetical protein
MEPADVLVYFVIAILTIGIVKIFRPVQEETLKNFPDHEDAKKLLDSVRETAVILVEHMRTKYPEDAGIIQLVQRFKPDQMFEGIPGDVNFTYTENKGQKIVLCLRNDTPENELHTKNTVLFPLIHELSHVADVNYDPSHGSNFRSYFRLLLDEAMKLGLYSYVDFASQSVTYCGMKINGNP